MTLDERKTCRHFTLVIKAFNDLRYSASKSRAVRALRPTVGTCTRRGAMPLPAGQLRRHPAGKIFP